MKKGTLIALVVNNAVIAGALVLLHLRLLAVEGSLDKWLPLMAGRFSATLQLAQQNQWYINSIIAFLTQ